MELDQFVRQLGQLINEVERISPLLSEEIALDAKALVQDRIQTQGLAGAEYSSREVSVFVLYKSATNAAGRAFLKGKSRANYAEMKEAQFGTLPGVNLTLTGRMWAGIQISERLRSGDLFIAVYGGSDSEVTHKMKENIGRFGEFLLPNQAEQQEIAQATEQKLLTVLNKFL